MENRIDARGKACPIPVIMAKKEADQGVSAFSVMVDNMTAVENLKRFGKSGGYATAVAGEGTNFEVAFTKADGSDSAPESGNSVMTGSGAGTPDEACGCQLMDGYRTWAVFVGREGIGDGDPELGASLLKMFFYTLAQENDVPCYILFMNAGVNVPVKNDQVVEQLAALQEKGSEILVCGTCLNFYGIADGLKIGTVSNMYDIAGAMKSADKVITL